MMVDFFKEECQQVTDEVRFGLCDNDDKKPAYLATKQEENWQAAILNHQAKQIHFTAIDNCIDIVNEKGEMESRCDAMLVCDHDLFFVELKNKRASWKSEGLGQIEATLKKLIELHPEYYYRFKRRKGIVANARHRFPCFQEYDSEQREYFSKTYKMRLQFEAEIRIS